MESIYIHIPFCKQKCKYCDFNSFSGKDNYIEDYIKALKKEIQSFNFNPLKTIYFGGGTPSYIDEKYIEEIMSILPKKEGCEITIEVNPGTVAFEKLKKYYKCGINRLSIGLQTTNENTLKEIGRIHTVGEFQEAYDMARNVGFRNISTDLMFGLPNQKLDDIKESVEYLIKLGVEHVSCYSLILHGKIFNNLPEDSEEREMYYYIIKRLKEAGYEHYEISNFAKPGFKSRHNLVYWNQEEYVGVGAGASTYVENTRYTNEGNIQEYINKLQLGENIINVEEIQNLNDKINEYMILKLRLIDGVDINEINNKFNINVQKLFKDNIDKMVNLGLLEVDSTNIKLTSKGLDFANVVWEEFVL